MIGGCAALKSKGYVCPAYNTRSDAWDVPNKCSVDGQMEGKIGGWMDGKIGG